MADSERIELQLDLSQATASAAQLSAALATTKVDVTAFGAALESAALDEIKLVAETTAFQDALERLVAAEAKAEAETKRLADEAFAKLTVAQAEASAAAERLESDARDLTREIAVQKVAVKDLSTTYEVLGVAGHGYEVGQERATIQTTRAAAEIKRLADAETQAAAETERFAAQFRPLVVSLEQVAVAAKYEHDALSVVEVGMRGVSAGNSRLGQTMLTASYATQDFTSQLGTRGLSGALGAVQNNIPMLLVGLGAGAGLAGALSVVSVSAGLVYENWDKIATLWRDGETTKETERQKELAKSIEAVREATQKQLQTPAKADLAQGGDLAKTIKEFGGAQVRQELEKAYREQFGNFGQDHTRQAVEDIIGGAQKGDAQSRNLLSQMTDSTFIHRDSDVMRRLRGEKTSVEQKKDFDASNKAFLADNARQVAAEEAKSAAKAAAKDKVVDDLNAQGQQGEKALRDSIKADQADEFAKIKKGLELPTGDMANVLPPEAIAQQGEPTYHPMSHAERIAANRRRKARRDNPLPPQAMGPAAPDPGQSADQQVLARMEALIEINNRRAMAARQFQAAINNLPPVMDEGNW